MHECQITEVSNYSGFTVRISIYYNMSEIALVAHATDRHSKQFRACSCNPTLLEGLKIKAII